MAKSSAAKLRSMRAASAPSARRLRSVAGQSAESVAPSLDRLVHERVRLGILSALAANPALGFLELRSLLRATDGNLSLHARKLEEAGYLSCHKSFRGRVPKTEYRITPAGRRALERYLTHMEALIRTARGG